MLNDNMVRSDGCTLLPAPPEGEKAKLVTEAQSRFGGTSATLPSAALTSTLLTVIFALDFFVTLALLESHAYFQSLLCVLTLLVPAAAGSALALVETGIWSKVDRLPSSLRIAFRFGSAGLLPVAAFGILAEATKGKFATGRGFGQALQWLNAAALPMLVLTAFVQGSVAASSDIDAWLTLALTGLLLIKIAVEHDTKQHVYCWYRYDEVSFAGRELLDQKAWEESIPLVTGSLDGVLEPRALALLLFRSLEVTASISAVLLIHAYTSYWFRVLDTPIGGVAFLSAQFCAQSLVFRGITPWMAQGPSGLARALTACVFVPKPLLDADVSIVEHYAVISASQILMLACCAVSDAASTVPLHLRQAGCGSIMLMWIVLLPIRTALAQPNNAPDSILELAGKVKSGNAHLPSMTADMQSTTSPHFLRFFRSVCEHCFGSVFFVGDGVLRLDFQGSDLDVRIAQHALNFAAPLIGATRTFEWNFEGTDIADEDLEALARLLPPSLATFEVNVARSDISDEGLTMLSKRLPRSLANLEIGLNNTRVGDTGVRALAECLPTHLERLEVILYNTRVGDVGLLALTRNFPGRLVKLRVGLHQTAITDQGLIAMSSRLPPTLTTLKVELGGTSITDHGASALVEMLPKRLEDFEANVSGTQVSAQVRLLLKKAVAEANLPGVSVREEPARKKSGFCCADVPWFFSLGGDSMPHRALEV